ncbi:MAG: DUF2384 domain-containing protein [Nocardioides sp.]|nr:DUF2384 domain-containing protein [Nocardioides sp.]
MAGSVASTGRGNAQVARLIAKTRHEAGLTTAELANVVGIGHRQLQNWAAGTSTPATNEKLRRLLDLTYVLDLVEEIYGEEASMTWMHARNRMLEGERPLDLFTEGKADEVIALLDRLADGNL